MPTMYTDEDIEKKRDVLIRTDTGAQIGTPSTTPESVVPEKPTLPSKVFEDTHISGLRQTFDTLVGKAQAAKYVRSAELYKGLAAVVGQMLGSAVSERGEDVSAAVTTRGQDITAKHGLASLAETAGAHAETTRYHTGMLEHMAKSLGLEEEKVKAISENKELEGLRRELGALSKIRASALTKTAVTRGEPEMKRSWMGLGPFAPNAAMKETMAIEQAYQSGLKDVLGRYGVGMQDKPLGGETAEVPYWKRILQGEY